MNLADIRLRFVSLKLQIEDALAMLDRIEEDAHEDALPLACPHPSSERTAITTMGDEFKKFYCSACRTTVQTNEPVVRT